jgi:hypothetical protein
VPKLEFPAVVLFAPTQEDTMRRIQALSIALLVPLALVAGHQQAHAQFSTQVRTQLASIPWDGGFEQTHNTLVDHLGEGQYQFVTAYLTAGTSYMIVGACDEDCTDLDFTLYDPSWNYLAEDTGPDAVPAIIVTPRISGTYRLKVKMYGCYQDPCYWGVGIYR